ncbi:hypothetical protein CASFOL_026690 [Castilleja foliolosa]|uniref:Retrotransposon Copia-like N-terminal domain-containing protein n=1 Tax=Castilleja foliolosa TaxID=1961234 RepID=A0ABD3CHS7_9LAMI
MAEDTGSQTTGPSATIDGPKPQLLYPQNQLVSVKLNEGNFLVWKTQVLSAIKGYGLEDYINGESKTPEKFISNGSQSQFFL